MKMIKKPQIIAVMAALVLGFSSVASAGSLSTWPSTRGDGSRGYVYFGKNGVHWGRVGAGHFGHHSYKYPNSKTDYGCTNCYRGGYKHYDFNRYGRYDY